MNRLPMLSDQEFEGTLMNALLTAADKYRANAAEFRKLKPKLEQQERDEPDKVAWVHSSACEPMAEQFDQQVKDVQALMDKLQEQSVDA